MRGICGSGAGDYRLGHCGVRWALVLAVIAFFDSVILACLAFTMAQRVVRPSPHRNLENNYVNAASMFKGILRPHSSKTHLLVV